MEELHVVALSGGKDSTAMALLLQEREPRKYTYVCTPTGDELPEMFEHWRDLSVRLGSELVPVIGGSLKGLIQAQRCLPNWRMRWCTRMLKIEPMVAWLLQQQPRHASITLYVGLRADEEEREGGDYARVPDIIQRFPLRDWNMGLSDVVRTLDERGVIIPERTDCARCFFQTLGEWWVLWKEHPDIYADAEQDEETTGHTFRSDGRDTWPAQLKQLRLRFQAGYVPRNTNQQRDMFSAMRCRVCRT